MPRRKCIKCSSKPFVYLKYANAAFCREHFVDFFVQRIKKNIRKYKMIKEKEKIAIGVSGGKDSVSLLHALSSLKKEMKFELYGIVLDLGIKNFSEESVKAAETNLKNVEIEYEVFNIKKEYGFTLEDMVMRIKYRNPCSICGVIKRYLLNKLATEIKADKLATGHNLDDFARFLLTEFISMNIDALKRLSPITPPRDKMVGRIKPLFLTPEKDCNTYVKATDVPVVRGICPYKLKFSNKTIFEFVNKLEENRKITLVRGFIHKIKPRLGKTSELKLGKCKECGFPSSGEICSFCKLCKSFNIH